MRPDWTFHFLKQFVVVEKKKYYQMSVFTYVAASSIKLLKKLDNGYNEPGREQFATF